MKYSYLSLVFLLLALEAYPQGGASCELSRQTFSILTDNEGTSLGAELLVGEYLTNISFGVLLQIPETGSWTNTPEYLILKQSRLLATGDIEGAVAMFAPTDKEKARKIFADPKGLKNYFSDLSEFRLLAKAEFGQLTRIRYESSPLKTARGHRATMSAYFIRENGKYVFVVEPREAQIFALAAASFPHWKSKAERAIPERDQERLLNATFTSGGTQFHESRVIIKYRLEATPGDSIISKSTNSLGKFLNQMLNTYRRYDTNEIISLWGTGFDQVAIKGMIQNRETRATADYFSKFPEFELTFYIKNGDQYWVYINPQQKREELKLLRMLKTGDTFKMTLQFDDVFADKILSSDEMMRVLLQQAQQ